MLVVLNHRRPGAKRILLRLDPGGFKSNDQSVSAPGSPRPAPDPPPVTVSKTTHRGVPRPPLVNFNEEPTPNPNRRMSYQIRRIASPRQSELLHFLGGDKKILNRREASLENRHPKKQEPPTPYPSYQPETSYQPQ
ncbi:hypothetical protein F2Q69_00030180 [Brassica cretica]|uniref:Uncharacterized protein n=1 Tax=Brassica cretica TaxID=69181 RepID=A0A8S9S996_BRACR|nr:hypothetical protein F2Q69_00030180 [Brassica cretica]